MNSFIRQIIDNFFNLYEGFDFNKEVSKSRKLIKDVINNFYLNEEDSNKDIYILDKIKDNGADNTPMIDGKSDDEILLTNAPIIYAFITSDVDDAIKIGYTDQGAEKRLSQWRQKYHNVQPLGWWTSMEVNQAKEKVFFKDYPVHDRTIERGYERLVDQDFKDMEKSKGLTDLHVSREFFRKYSNKSEGQIDNLSKEIIEDILKEMKQNIKDNNVNFTLYTLQADGNVNKASRIMEAPTSYSETDLQRDCINNGVNAIKKYKASGNTSKPLDMLMAAVMRFGKTHAAYQIIKESGIKYALVTSAKADTRPAWRNDINHVNYIDDFCFIEFNGNYDYLVSEAADTPQGKRIMTSSFQDSDIIDKKRKEGKTVIVYATLQDLAGKLQKVNDIDLSINEAKQSRLIKDKHKYLFDNPPEIIVIDETHYGTHSATYGATTGLSGDDDIDLKAAKKEAALAEKTISPIKTNIRLQCSGTPYYILASGEFADEDKEIITKVSFSDMLNARDKWIEDHPNEDPSNSPYYGIPSIKKFGMKLTKEAEQAALDKNLDISLNELFRVQGNQFVHEDAIIDLFSALFGAHGKQMPGFMDKRQIQEGKLFQHIVICTPSIDSANILSRLLVEKDIIDENERKVLLAVERREGGDRAIKSKFNDSDDLKRELEKLDNEGIRSVTITVNRFLTGVSMPLWDSMFMMKDTRSPQEYDQAIFRICTRNIGYATDNQKGEKIKVNRKENVYLIDFCISRMFKMTIDSAVAECKAKNMTKPSDMKAIIEQSIKNVPMLAEETVWDAENGQTVLKGLRNMEVEDLLKRYMEYDKNKSISETIDQKLKSNVFKHFCTNPNNIKWVNHFKESGIGSVGPNNTEGTDNVDFNQRVQDQQNEESNSENQETPSVKSSDKDNKDNKNIAKIIESKFKTMLKNLLYSCLCFDKIPEDTDEFLETVLNDKKADQIIETFGLTVDDVDDIVSKGLSNKEKTEVNFMLLQLKTLADDEELKAKSPAQGFINAVNKLGRLDDKSSNDKEVALVITPHELAEKMVNKIPEETMRKAESILEVNSKTGEFMVEIYNKYGKDIANKVKIVAGDDRCKMFIRKILNLLDLNEYNIIDIEDKDGNGKYDVKDFLELKNEELLSMNNGKRFDVCLMNPPYGSKKSGLGPYIHFDFADKCSNISDINICVMPFRMMSSSSEEYNEFKENYNKILESVEEYPSESFIGTGMGSVGIYKFINDKHNTKTEILYLDNTHRTTEDLLDLGIFSEYEVHIVKYIEAKKLNYNAFRPSKENKNNKLIEFSNKYLKRFSDNQCFLTANLANGGMNGKFISGNAGKILRNKSELINEIIRTKGSAKVIMAFDNVHSAENCKAALMNPLMRFCLFKLQDDQNMTARVYKYVPDIDWEDDRVLTDEGLLEVCGCPKDKAKEYAEYCKKYIEENVDKK